MKRIFLSYFLFLLLNELNEISREKQEVQKDNLRRAAFGLDIQERSPHQLNFMTVPSTFAQETHQKRSKKHRMHTTSEFSMTNDFVIAPQTSKKKEHPPTKTQKRSLLPYKKQKVEVIDLTNDDK